MTLLYFAIIDHVYEWIRKYHGGQASSVGCVNSKQLGSIHSCPGKQDARGPSISLTTIKDRDGTTIIR